MTPARVVAHSSSWTLAAYEPGNPRSPPFTVSNSGVPVVKSQLSRIGASARLQVTGLHTTTETLRELSSYCEGKASRITVLFRIAEYCSEPPDWRVSHMEALTPWNECLGTLRGRASELPRLLKTRRREKSNMDNV